jgi:arsenate reductase
MKKRFLFVCIHNSARSQMAEAFMNKLAGDRFEAESAGIEPAKINPIVVTAMQEKGIDLSGRKTKSVESMIARGPYFNYVVTVCDETSSERCPVFPGAVTRLHWPFADPSSFRGSDEEKLARTRIVREEVKHKIEDWIAQQ